MKFSDFLNYIIGMSIVKKGGSLKIVLGFRRIVILITVWIQ